MKNHKKIQVTALLILIAFAFFLSAPDVSAASLFERASEGFETMVGAAYGSEVAEGTNFDTFTLGLITIINFLVSLIGVIFLFIIIYAGWLWMTARGNEETVEKAKKLLKEAVIGLVIMILAKIITELVLVLTSKAITNV